MSHALVDDAIWATLERLIPKRRPSRGRLDQRWTVIDSGSVRAVRGGKTGPNPTDRRKAGSKLVGAATSAGQVTGEVRALADVERDYIAAALLASGVNRARSAEELGIGVATLYRKLKQRQ